MTTDLNGDPILILTVDEAEMVRDTMGDDHPMSEHEWALWDKINRWLLDAYIHNRERETNG